MTTTESILVLGATSHIARATCHALAAPGRAFILVARDEVELARCAADLRIRHDVTVHERVFRAEAFSEHRQWVDDWCELAGGTPAGVLLCFGHSPRESVAQDEEEALRTIAINLSAAVSLLTLLAVRMARSRQGWIAGVSSVAGDRGRASNYVYGAAKAGLTTYLDGLRGRLCAHGVHVLTVKPGFVDTPMLAGAGARPRFFVAPPERVARDIRVALERRRNVLYTPWYWRTVMFAIRCIPEALFKRLPL